MSPSDLKHIDAPEWIDPTKGEPTLMLFSVVDDCSGVAYQEYHSVYGEDVESALRFLYAAMAPKVELAFPRRGGQKCFTWTTALWQRQGILGCHAASGRGLADPWRFSNGFLSVTEPLSKINYLTVCD
jgi:hypothetical protein